MNADDISSHIGRRLSERRRSLGLSLAEVSSRCGVTLQQIHRYETGDNTISAPMLWTLARCLGVDLAWFFEGLAPGPAALLPANRAGAAVADGPVSARRRVRREKA
jgi:transcriptional regulator with XRE-family HTH domain